MKDFVHRILNRFKEMNPREPRTVTLIGFVCIAIVCGILNIFTSPLPWVMMVVGFERLVWKLIFGSRFFENSLPEKLLAFVRGISVFLIGLMIWLYQSPAAIIALSLLVCGLQFGSAVLYLFQYRKSTILSPVYLLGCLLVNVLCLINGLIVNSYAVIMVSIAAVMFIAPALILIQDKLLFEGKKRLHMC